MDVFALAAKAEHHLPSSIDGSAKVAMAFAISILLVIVVQSGTLLVDLRLKRIHEGILDHARKEGVFAPDRDITNDMTATSQVALSHWVVDASQILAGLVGPLLGLLLVARIASRWTVFVFIAAILFSVVAFAVFVARSDPLSYGRKPYTLPLTRRLRIRPLGPITPIAVVMVAANFVFGAVSVLLA